MSNVTKRKLCAGHYQYLTPIGCFGLTGQNDGWSICQYTADLGTVHYGLYETMRDADAAMIEMCA